MTNMILLYWVAFGNMDLDFKSIKGFRIHYFAIYGFLIPCLHHLYCWKYLNLYPLWGEKIEVKVTYNWTV